MKAVVYREYGPPNVLQFEDWPKPTPKPNEVLIRTHATTVTSGDWRARSLDMPPGFRLIARLIFGIRRPRQIVLGSELAGTVEAIGDNVTKFGIGDRVFAFTGAGLGCYVEYKCMPETGTLVPMPSNLTFQEAAALSFGGTTALDFFRKGRLRKGEAILINGASGGVGTTAVQVAKHFGATVTGVCSDANVELVKSLGADHVIDYTKHDFTELGATYDLVMDTVGTAPFAKSRQVLRDHGRLLLVLGGLSDMLRAPWVSWTSDKRIIAGAAAELTEDLQFMAQLSEAGQFRPVIDRCHSIDEIVEAHRYVDSGRKKGNVVLSWEPQDVSESPSR